MPLVKREDDPAVAERRMKRILLCGPPNSRKTSSLATFPGPIAVLSYPGENGAAAIPTQTTDGHPIHAWVWDEPDPLKATSWEQTLQEVKRVTAEILTGKHGKYRTFAGDGIHKLNQYYVKTAQSMDQFTTKGGEYDGRRGWPWVHEEFFKYIQSVVVSQSEYVVFTCWDEMEKDDPFAQDRPNEPTPRHSYPALPGKAAKLVMGEMSVLYSYQEGAGTTAKYQWLTQPFNRVWGAGLKLPKEIAIKVPLKVDQDWQGLEKLFGR